MCHPTSASPRRLSQPCGTHRNNHTTRTIKKQSENEGMTNLAQPRENAALEAGDPATTTPAATDCWDVATVDHRQRAYQAIWCSGVLDAAIEMALGLAMT